MFVLSMVHMCFNVLLQHPLGGDEEVGRDLCKTVH